MAAGLARKKKKDAWDAIVKKAIGKPRKPPEKKKKTALDLKIEKGIRINAGYNRARALDKFNRNSG